MTTATAERIPEMLSWREAEHAETPDLDALAATIAPMCGLAGAAGDFRDLNTTWECARAARLYHLHSDLEEMRRTAAKRARYLARDKTYYAANLNAWLIWKAGQLAFLRERFAELPCSHEHPQEFADYRDALPACTC